MQPKNWIILAQRGSSHVENAAIPHYRNNWKTECEDCALNCNIFENSRFFLVYKIHRIKFLQVTNNRQMCNYYK